MNQKRNGNAYMSEQNGPPIQEGGAYLVYPASWSVIAGYAYVVNEIDDLQTSSND